MKTLIASLPLSALVALSLSACGAAESPEGARSLPSPEAPSEKAPERARTASPEPSRLEPQGFALKVGTLASLPDCLPESEGRIAWVVSEKGAVVCDGSQWMPIDLRGDKGEKGERGEQGEQGLAGAAGAQGTTGTAGIDGADGLDGQDGADGSDGASGNQPHTARKTYWIAISGTDSTSGFGLNPGRIGTTKAVANVDTYADGSRCISAHWFGTFDGIDISMSAARTCALAGARPRTGIMFDAAFGFRFEVIDVANGDQTKEIRVSTLNFSNLPMVVTPATAAVTPGRQYFIE
jgi:Collagen triple helix repeat (20 copies)